MSTRTRSLTALLVTPLLVAAGATAASAADLEAGTVRTFTTCSAPRAHPVFQLEVDGTWIPGAKQGFYRSANCAPLHYATAFQVRLPSTPGAYNYRILEGGVVVENGAFNVRP